MIRLKAYAKVNLSLEVVGRREDGYHDIISFMQDVSLYDDVEIMAGCVEAVRENVEAYSGCETAGCGALNGGSRDVCIINGVEVYFSSDSPDIPAGMTNLAMRGAGAVLEALPAEVLSPLDLPKAIGIRIGKKLPIAAGIAGGSGNAAAVMLGINKLLGNVFTLEQLMLKGAGFGADVPFSLMMNAYRNSDALDGLEGLDWAMPSAMTRGIGDIVEPCEPITRYVIMVNPGIAVSTGEAYNAIDGLPDREVNTKLFYNIFEEYACNRYPAIRELITDMRKDLAADRVVMSGSGSTVVAYYTDESTAKNDFIKLQNSNWAGMGRRMWCAISGGRR